MEGSYILVSPLKIYHEASKGIFLNKENWGSFPLSHFNEYLFEEFFSHSSDKEERRNFKLRFLEFREHGIRLMKDGT